LAPLKAIERSAVSIILKRLKEIIRVAENLKASIVKLLNKILFHLADPKDLRGIGIQVSKLENHCETGFKASNAPSILNFVKKVDKGKSTRGFEIFIFYKVSL
jgi:hypothetical protein